MSASESDTQTAGMEPYLNVHAAGAHTVSVEVGYRPIEPETTDATREIAISAAIPVWQASEQIAVAERWYRREINRLLDEKSKLTENEQEEPDSEVSMA